MALTQGAAPGLARNTQREPGRKREPAHLSLLLLFQAEPSSHAAGQELPLHSGQQRQQQPQAGEGSMEGDRKGRGGDMPLNRVGKQGILTLGT